MEDLENKTRDQLLKELEKSNKRIAELEKSVIERKIAEEAINETKSLLQTTLESTADGILVVDLQGRIVAYNEIFMEIWEMSENIIPEGKTRDLVSPENTEYAMKHILGQLINPEEFIAKVQELYSKPEDESFDILKFKDGRVIERYSKPQNLNDKPIGRVWSFRDVTERKRAEEKLQKSEARQALVLRSLPMALYIAQPYGDYGGTWVSEQIGKISGFTAEQFMNDIHLWASRLHPEDRDRVLDEFNKVLEKETIDIEYRWKAADGRYIWFLDSGVLIRDEKGKPFEIIGTWLDITKRKQAEEVLHQYEHIVSSSTDMLAILDKQFNYLAANNAYLKAFKLTSEQLIGSTVAKVFGEEFFKTVIKPGADRCLGGEEVNYQDWFDFPTYGRCFMDITYYPYYSEDNKIMGFVVNGRDITERTQAEEEMQKLAALVKHSSELVNLSTLDGRMTFLNESGSKMLGIESHEVENVNIMEVIPDHLKGQVEKELLPALMKGGTWEGDLQYRNMKTGELTDVHAMTFTITDPNTGEPQFLANVSMDITKSKRAEKALRESEEKYRTIFESSPEAIVLFDNMGNVININGRIEDWLGYKPKDIIGKNLAEFPFLSKKSKELALKRFSLRMTGKEIPPFELEFNDKKGEKYIGLTAATSIKDEKGEITQNLVMISNITEQKQAQKALWESEDRLSKVMLAANDGMWDWNLRTNEVYFDPRYYTMSGYNVGEFPYQLEEFQKRIHPEDTEYVMANAERHLKGEIERFIVEFRFARSDGNWMWILGKGVIVERDDDGSPTRFVGTHTDITKRKQTEAELEKYREHLEELVKERTAELEEKNKKLIQFNKLFVDREFRIKDLKDKVKELEGKLGRSI